MTHPPDVQASPQRIRYVHEFLFALNIALVAQLEGNQKPNRVFGLLEWGEIRLQLRIAERLNLHPHSYFASNVAFVICSLASALVMFLLLRLASRTLVTQRLLRFAGILSLVALPASWLYSTYLIGWWFIVLPTRLLLLLIAELLLATVCGIAYLYGKWPLPAWANIILALVHFAFIQTVCFGPYFWLGPNLQPIVTFAGFFSTIAWGVYISPCPLRQEGQRGAERTLSG